MKRKTFLQAIGVAALAGGTYKLSQLDRVTKEFSGTDRMPVLFLGHGSPMNAIEENEFVRGFRETAKFLPKPQAILCVSAHWETRGTYVTAMEKPKTIYDFGGFPKALYEVKYPAPGSPAVAHQTKDVITKTEVGLDQQWGLDHGCWTVVKHLYPDADVPVLQLSLDYTKPAQYHYDLAKELSSLRKKEILIIGSGNMVHNLGAMAWDQMQKPDYAFDWAQEASQKMKGFILNDDHQQLINYQSHGRPFELAIPTPEHYLPLLYTLALKEEKDNISLFNDKAVAGSITMTSIRVG